MSKKKVYDNLYDKLYCLKIDLIEEYCENQNINIIEGVIDDLIKLKEEFQTKFKKDYGKK